MANCASCSDKNKQNSEKHKKEKQMNLESSLTLSFTLYLKSISKVNGPKPLSSCVWRDSFLPGLWLSLVSPASSQSGILKNLPCLPFNCFSQWFPSYSKEMLWSSQQVASRAVPWSSLSLWVTGFHLSQSPPESLHGKQTSLLFWKRS